MSARVLSSVALVLTLMACGARTDLALDPEAGTPDAVAPECTRDEHCDDAVPCTEDRCESETCTYRTRDDACDDELFCTGPGRCDLAAGCVYERPPCNDRVMCTLDTCDEVRDRCEVEPRSELCPLSHRCDPELGCVARAIVHDETWLYEVDLPSGAIERLARAELSFTDVSLHPDGRLFAISSESLFELDEADGAARFIAALPERTVGLDVTPEGDLVAAGISTLLRVDPDTGASSFLARFPVGFGASGDIAFVRGRMLVATTDRPGTVSARPDFLFEVPADGSPAFEVGVIGIACVWGLAPFGDTLYGFTCNGQLLEIDPDTGAGRVIASLGSRRIGGAAAR